MISVRSEVQILPGPPVSRDQASGIRTDWSGGPVKAAAGEAAVLIPDP